ARAVRAGYFRRDASATPPSHLRRASAAMHSAVPGPSPRPPRRAATGGPIAMGAIISHSRILRGWRLSHHHMRDTAYLATERISGAQPQYPGHLAATASPR